MAGASCEYRGGCGEASKRGVEGMLGDVGAECVHRTGGADSIWRDAGPLMVADMGARAG